MKANKTFGRRLADLRIDHDMTQQQLAEKIGVTQTTVSDYEKDISHPRIEVMLKIVDVFDVSFDYLFGKVDYIERFDALDAEYCVYEGSGVSVGRMIELLMAVDASSREEFVHILKNVGIVSPGAIVSMIEIIKKEKERKS